MTDLILTVEIVSGRPVVSSLKVAEQFGKNHAHVLRDIRKIITEVSEEFSQSNFGSADYADEQGKARVMYWMTKDGFTILAMGYTGREVMRLKEAYIRRFNDMEQELHGRALPSAPTPQPLPLTLSTTESRKPLDRLIKAWAQQSGIAHAQCWAMVNAHFNLKSVSELPVAWVPDAITFVQERIDVILQSGPKALPESPKLALPAAQVDDLKDKAVAYYNKVMDANYACNKEFAEVERLGRELTDAMGAAIMPMIGANSDPASIVARHKFLDALKSSPRCAMRSMDVSILALIDHAQLMCGLSVLGR